ncbi:MAG: type I secretion C-terminal target domain-containing protein [Devosia sp.]
MTVIDHTFLETGFKWDQNEIGNLGFAFATSTPAHWYSNPIWQGEFETTVSGVELSGFSNPSTYDEKDAVRYALLDYTTLSGLSGSDTINSTLLNSFDYRVSFSDVISATISENSAGEIQLITHQGLSQSSQSLATSPNSGVIPGADGDISFNRLDPLLNDLKPGEGGYWLIQHELGHAVGGLEDVADTSQSGTKYDFMKYTMMSYNTYGGVYASGLMLLDIAALQDTYGTTNTATRSGDTTYKLGQGLGFSGASATDAFLYTIWDGDGNDTIDVSDFGVRAEIDLREGRFSSIGVDSSGNEWNWDIANSAFDEDPGNVAIAYGTIIESAKGTDYDDRIIGNDYGNTLHGGDGNDTLISGKGENSLYGEAGDDTIELDLTDSRATYTTAFGGAGNNTYSFNGGSDVILQSTHMTASTGIVNDVEDFYFTGNTNYKNTSVIAYGEDILSIDATGREFKSGADGYSTPVLDYSLIAHALEFDLTNTSGFEIWNKSTSLLEDSYSGNGVTYTSIVGTNHGDKVIVGSMNGIDNDIISHFLLGSGNDIVEVHDPKSSASIITYSSGNDVVEFQRTSFILDARIALDPTIASSDVSFSIQNKDASFGSATQFSYDLLVTVNGRGTITLKNRLGIIRDGPDGLPNTGDEYDQYAGVWIQQWDQSTNIFDPVNVTVVSGLTDVIGYGTFDNDASVNGSSGADEMRGYSGDDTLNGLAGDDEIYGGIGKDTLNGGDGNDELYGGLEDDALRGDGDNDYLYGNQGDDTLNGGTGNDWLYGENNNDMLNGDDGDDRLWGDLGNDTLDGGLGGDELYGGGGNDILIDDFDGTANGNDGIDEFRIRSNVTEGVSVNLSTGIFTGLSSRATGYLGTIEDVTTDHGNYDDTLTGDVNANVLKSGDGDDTLNGGDGDDTLDGGNGTDTVDFAVATDGITVNLTTGTAIDDNGDNDTLANIENISGSAYDDDLTGSNDVNLINAGAGNDTVDGRNGADTLNGGIGSDNLSGGSGADSLNGDTGDDNLTGGTGNDTLNGGDGTDTADYSAAAAGVDVNLLSGSATDDGDGGSDTLSNIENIIGSAFADTLRGDHVSNTIWAGAGNDTVLGRDGADVFYGEDGDDNIQGDQGDDTLHGGDGADGLYGDEGNDILYGDDGNDILAGKEDNDILYGGAGNDTLYGEAGDDALDGGSGIDRAVYSTATAGVTVNLVAGTATGEGSDTLSGIENVTGSDYDDTFFGDGEDNTFIGGTGTDTVDYSLASAGVDVNLLSGTASDDGEGGSDTLSGIENIIGSAHADILKGDHNVNDIRGGDGGDTIQGRDGNDTLYGEAGDDHLTGYGDDDLIDGGSGNDQVYGNAGNDTLFGGDGDDLIGGKEDNDILYGGDGFDKLWGDGGADTFVFESASAFNDADEVRDFDTTEGDALNLVDLLTAYDPLTDNITDFVEITDSGANSVVKVDTTGTATFGAGTQIATLIGVTGLTDEAQLETNGHLITA